MKPKNLMVLFVVALVLVVAAVLQSRQKQQSAAVSDRIGQPVLSGLGEPDRMNSIAQIVFERSDSTVKVARVNDIWVAPAKHNYPVDFKKVREFVRKLADMKVGQTVAAGTNTVGSLGLAAPGTPGAKPDAVGTAVSCLDTGGTAVVQLTIGKERKAKPRSSEDRFGGGGYPDGRYVAAGSAAYVVTETFGDLPSTVKDWLDDDLVNVVASDITDVRVTDTNLAELAFTRPEAGGDLKLGELAEKEEMDASKVSALTGIFSYLTFSDVADPSLGDADTGLDKPAVCVAKTKEGKIYTLKVGRAPGGSDDRYVRLSAAFEPPPEPAPKPEEPAAVAAQEPAQSDEAGAQMTDEAKKADEAKKKADEEEARRKKEEEARQKEKLERAEEIRNLNQRVGPWTYLVKSYKVDKISATRADFIKAKEAPKEEANFEEPEEAEPAAATEATAVQPPAAEAQPAPAAAPEVPPPAAAPTAPPETPPPAPAPAPAAPEAAAPPPANPQ